MDPTTSSRCQHTDHGRYGLNQQAERDNQQREACAGRVDVGLEPGYLCHRIVKRGITAPPP